MIVVMIGAVVMRMIRLRAKQMIAQGMLQVRAGGIVRFVHLQSILTVIARSEATKQSRASRGASGLLRFARNDEAYGLVTSSR
jgi:hypothetical protein